MAGDFTQDINKALRISCNYEIGLLGAIRISLMMLNAGHLEAAKRVASAVNVVSPHSEPNHAPEVLNIICRREIRSTT